MTAEFTAMPAIFRHCVSVYHAMESQASWQELFETGETGLVYEGRLTILVTQDIGLSLPYYTDVTRALQEMGCIVQLRRGGGTTGSLWELKQEPTRILWGESDFKRVASNNVTASRRERADQQMRDLRDQVDSLNDRTNALEEAFQSLFKG